MILATGAQANPRTKTETRKQERRAGIFRGKKIERRRDVLLLAASLVVRALAQPRAPEVESQNGQAEAMERFRRLVDHFVVQRPAKQRMRMAHHGSKRGLRAIFTPRDGPKERFEPARRPP